MLKVEDERLRVRGLAVFYLSVGTKGPGQSSAVVYAAVALRVSGLGWRESAYALYRGVATVIPRAGLTYPVLLVGFVPSLAVVTVVPS